MATWHQQRHPVDTAALTRDGTYAVIIDPPNQCRAVMSGFATRKEAQAYIDRCDGYRPGSAAYSRVVEPCVS